MDADSRKKIVLEYYNNSAKKYGEEYEKTIAGKYFLKKKIKIAIQMGNFNGDSHILDAGCANGYFSLDLAKRGFKVTGVDLSKNNIEECKIRAKILGLDNIEFRTSDLEDLGIFKEDQFDGVISFATLRYVPDVVKALKELHRVTKKGGAVIVDFPNKYSPWFIIFQRFAYKYILPHDKECDIHHTIKQSKELMKQAGFKDIEVKVDFWIARTTPNYLAPPFIILDQVMSNIPLIKNLGGAIIVKGVK